MQPMRHVHGLLSRQLCDGPHTKAGHRDVPGGRHRGVAREQHDLDLCVLLPVHDALPCRHPDHRPDLRPQTDRIESDTFPNRLPTHIFSEVFIDMVKRYGRNYETGLILRYFLRTNPLALFGRRRAGIALWRHGRLPILPNKIEGIDGLRRIIAKAETFDLPQEIVERQTVTDSVGYAAIGR